MSSTVWRTSLGMSTYVEVVISPATSTSPVVSRVSHATRLSGSSARSASRTESEIWSAILSGWPSVTDSEVKVYRVLTGGSILIGGAGPGRETEVVDGDSRRSRIRPTGSTGSRCRQERAHPIQYGVGHGILGAKRDSGHRTVRTVDGDFVGVVVESDPGRRDVVGHHQVDPFGRQFGHGPLRELFGLRRESRQYLPLS